MQYRFQVTRKDRRKTLDRFLALKAGFSLEETRDLIRFGAVWVNRDRETDGNRILAAGEEVTLNVPRHGVHRTYEAAPERILYQDSWVLAYDKEAGVPCQPTPYDGYNNVYEALRRLGAGGSWSPGEASPAAQQDAPVREAPPAYLAMHHRLDLEVSGVMIFARAVRANTPLFEAFRDRRVDKVYLAVVCGTPEEDSWVEKAPIGRQGGRYLCVGPGEGKEAETAFRVHRRAAGLALVEARPRTGRTHQIRLHLARSGFPILGDRQHGGRSHARCMLHAHILSLTHPVSGKGLAIEAPLPGAFHEAMDPAG